MPQVDPKKFEQKVNLLIKQARNLDDNAVKEVFSILQTTQENIINILARTDISDFTASRMQEILNGVDTAVIDFQSRYSTYLTEQLDEAVDLGRRMIDEPIVEANIGASVKPITPPELVDVGLRMSADLVQNISDDMRKTINNEIQLGLLGGKSPQEVITAISKDKKFRRGKFKSLKVRAETITRTEINRALNISAQAREEQYKDIEGLGKAWLHTSDSRTRSSHRAVGNNTNPAYGGTPIKIDSNFTVGGYKASGPYDPRLPAKEVISCRCTIKMTFGDEKKGKPDVAKKKIKLKDLETKKAITFKPQKAFTEEDLIYEWTRGSKRKTSVIMKEAAKREFNIDGLSYTKRKYNILDTDIKSAQKSIRKLYKTTQNELKGKKTIKLYRGTKTQYSDIGVLESWTTSEDIARKFDGQSVFVAEIPIERILTYHKSALWKDGPYGAQFEYIVLREAPK